MQPPGFDPSRCFTSFQSNVPQLEATVDRTKAKQQGVALTDVFETLQIYLGSAYVNDFNLFGRTYTRVSRRPTRRSATTSPTSSG